MFVNVSWLIKPCFHFSDSYTRNNVKTSIDWIRFRRFCPDYMKTLFFCALIVWLLKLLTNMTKEHCVFNNYLAEKGLNLVKFEYICWDYSGTKYHYCGFTGQKQLHISG